MGSSEPPRRLVLVVEDDVFQMMDTVDTVQQAGFDTIEATDADQAMGLLRDRPDIRVLITDVEMPGSMDGLKLAAIVREQWPDIKVVVVSGRSGLTSDLMPAQCSFIGKPYDARRLQSVLLN